VIRTRKTISGITRPSSPMSASAVGYGEDA
jgi:hypothetical protein